VQVAKSYSIFPAMRLRGLAASEAKTKL